MNSNCFVMLFRSILVQSVQMSIQVHVLCNCEKEACNATPGFTMSTEFVPTPNNLLPIVVAS